MNTHFRDSKSTKVTGREMRDVLELDKPFGYAREAVSDRANPPATRLIRRRKGNSESEDKQVLLALDLASLLSYSTNNDGANVGQRRRAQNRASQRAFRERKRSHTEDLQKELDKLHETHRFLQQTYQQTVDELSTMQAYVEELSFEITVLRMKPNAQQGYFGGVGTVAWKTAKLESPPSYFEAQPTDFNASLQQVVDDANMERALASNPEYSPSVASSSTGGELIWS